MSLIVPKSKPSNSPIALACRNHSAVARSEPSSLIRPMMVPKAQQRWRQLKPSCASRDGNPISSRDFSAACSTPNRTTVLITGRIDIHGFHIRGRCRCRFSFNQLPAIHRDSASIFGGSGQTERPAVREP